MHLCAGHRCLAATGGISCLLVYVTYDSLNGSFRLLQSDNHRRTPPAGANHGQHWWIRAKLITVM